MSELSVSDHLEGILSDFEALKRSFDIEDVDDIPSFSTASAVSTPVSHSSTHFFLHHNKAGEELGGGGQSPSSAYNNSSLGPTADHSCTSLSSIPSPVLRSRAVVSSRSFNRGTMNKSASQNNSSAVSRAASFQSRLNPNVYSMLCGPGSDNDSLHSSTSSLDYSGGGGSTLPPTKLGAYSSPPLPVEYHKTLPQVPEQHRSGGANPGNNPHLKKFSFQSCDAGGAMVGMQSIESGGQGSSGLGHTNANANWNRCLNNASSLGEEGYSGSKKNYQPVKTPQPKAKETSRLNKFPLNLDNLVNSTIPTKTQGRFLSPNTTKPPPRNTGGLRHHTSLPSTSTSPSASLSSLDGASETPPLSLHHPFFPLSPRCLPQLERSIPFSEMICSQGSISSPESPQKKILSGPPVADVVPIVSSPSSPFSPRVIWSVADNHGDARDSVGSILQRIASFSQHAVTDPTPATLTPTVQSNGGLLSDVGCPAVTILMPTRKEEKKQQETAAQLDRHLHCPMEERQENERGIMGQEQEDHLECQEQPASPKTQNSKMAKEEKGMEEGEMRKETEETLEVDLEAQGKVELCPSVQDLQMSYIEGPDLFGYVGIEAVLDQMRRKTIKAGLEFNIMVVGQSGLGKSTLVNTLFKSKVSRKSCTPNYEEKISKTVKLHSVSHVIEEKGVKMRLTVIDTPGFGDHINNENCWNPIVQHINEQYEKYLREEININRKRRIPDSRVHCCIYFLPATGHRLRPIDVEFMKRLGKIVSIVPVIAKADTLTIEERHDFKERIRQDFTANGIGVYPQTEHDEDPEERILNDRIRESIPFAVVGTDKEHQVNGNKVLGRKTKWGIIEVENVAHCEFANLRDLLIRSHLQDLKDVTHDVHYETYRVHRLNESNVDFSDLGRSTWPLENGCADKCESDSHL
ncbi:uncharacterized protein AB9W97_000469 [Spinachia spinachia]